MNVAEEARDPRHDFPRALFSGLAIAGVIYLTVAVVASMAVPTATLAASDGPLLEVVKLGPLAINTKVYAAIALCAVANGALINMIMASRLRYGMSEQGVLPAAFARVLPGRRTPWVAIVFTTTLAAILVCTGDLATLADVTVLLLLAVFAVVNVAVLVLRRDPVDHDHFRAPTFLPPVGIAVSVGVMLTKDADVFARAGLLIVAGLVFWALNAVVLRSQGRASAPPSS